MEEPKALPNPATIPRRIGLKSWAITVSMATPGPGNRMVALLMADMKKAPTYPQLPSWAIESRNAMATAAPTIHTLTATRMCRRTETLLLRPDFISEIC